MIIKLIRYTNGYVRFRVTGNMPERLLNLAAREGLTVWEVKRKDGVLYACIAARFYYRLARLGRRAGVRVRLDKKRGIPFHVNQYRHRAGLLVGAVLFVLTFYSMSFFVWNVEISGQENFEEHEIRAALEELGVLPGAYRGNMDTQLLANRLVVDLPALSWAAINIVGSNAYVEVREVEAGEQRLPTDRPCNIKAARDGVILAVEAMGGYPAVKVGEAVVEGDLLISGIWEDDIGNVMLLHAFGSVTAETYRTERLEYPIEQTVYIAAGNAVHCRRLVLFGLSIPLSFTLPPDEPVSRESAETEVSIGKMHLPISVCTDVWTPLQPYQKIVTEDEATAAAAARIEEICGQWQEEGIRILETKLEKKSGEGTYIFEYSFVCEENIAVQEELNLN